MALTLTIERDEQRRVWRFVTSQHGAHTYSFDAPFTAASSLVAFVKTGYVVSRVFGISLSGVPQGGKRYAIASDGSICEQERGALARLV